MDVHQQFQILMSLLMALNQCSITVSEDLSFSMGDVERYQAVEIEVSGKPVIVEGKPKTEPLVQLRNGHEIFLTEAQNSVFRPVWNQKVLISNSVIACVGAIHAGIIQLNQQPAQIPAQPPQG